MTLIDVSPGSALDAFATDDACTQPCLPLARGPITEWLFAHLSGTNESVTGPHSLPAAPALGSDVQLALYCINRLSLGGFAHVDEAMEWDDDVLVLRSRLQRRFEDELRRLAADIVLPQSPSMAASALLARSAPSIADHIKAPWQAREVLVLKGAYLLMEADPHAMAVARADACIKQALMDVQSGEYGVGHADTHARIFANSMTAAALNGNPLAYLPITPAMWLAQTNLMMMLATQRRLRGALLGHLALTEMDSVGPNSSYSEAFEAVGMPVESRRWFDIHVMADAVHGPLTRDKFLIEYPQRHPEQADELRFGATACWLIDQAAAQLCIFAWSSGDSALHA